METGSANPGAANPNSWTWFAVIGSIMGGIIGFWLYQHQCSDIYKQVQAKDRVEKHLQTMIEHYSETPQHASTMLVAPLDLPVKLMFTIDNTGTILDHSGDLTVIDPKIASVNAEVLKLLAHRINDALERGRTFDGTYIYLRNALDNTKHAVYVHATGWRENGLPIAICALLKTVSHVKTNL